MDRKYKKLLFVCTNQRTEGACVSCGEAFEIVSEHLINNRSVERLKLSF